VIFKSSYARLARGWKKYLLTTWGHVYSIVDQRRAALMFLLGGRHFLKAFYF